MTKGIAMENETADVLVLGAGAAGLAAARELSQAGLRVVVLEARDRLGGRMLTQHVPGYPLPIELGAEFVHGRPPESFEVINQAGLLVYEMNGDRWLAQEGRLTLDTVVGGQSDQLFAKMASADAPDRSFESFLAPFKNDPAWRRAAAMATNYIEGFDAADTSKMSVEALVIEQRTAETVDGDRAFRITNGYDRFVAALAAACDPSRVTMQLGTVAHRISWQRGHVEIQTTDNGGGNPRSFRARQAVITLPLGVLQAQAETPGAVTFEPSLAEHAAAAQQLAMGQVIKVTLRFRTRVWEHEQLPRATETMDPRQVSFFYGSDTTLPTWWTAYPAIVPHIVGWVGGPRAEQLTQQPKQDIIEQALESLAQLLDLPRSQIESELVEAHFHDWHADPFARGAYSYVTVGGMDAVRALAAPVEHTLFFAGEATNSEGQTGTVHGAIATGQRAAREILGKQ